MPPDPDIHLGVAFAAVLFALLFACIQLAINCAKPPRRRPDPPDDYPRFPGF